MCCTIFLLLQIDARWTEDGGEFTQRISRPADIEYPPEYYNPIKPLETRQLDNVRVKVDATAFEQGTCQRATHLAVKLG